MENTLNLRHVYNHKLLFTREELSNQRLLLFSCSEGVHDRVGRAAPKSLELPGSLDEGDLLTYGKRLTEPSRRSYEALEKWQLFRKIRNKINRNSLIASVLHIGVMISHREKL